MRRALLACGSAATAVLTVAGSAVAAEPEADLGVTVSSSAARARPGGLVDHTVTITNFGPATAAPVATVHLPDGLSVVGIDADYCRELRRVVECRPPALPAGTARLVRVQGVVKPTATGTLRTTAAVRSGTSDPDAANDTATLATPIEPGTDLRVRLRGPRAARGSRVPVVAMITNRGPRPVDAVVLRLGAHGASLLTAPADHCVQTRRDRHAQYLTCELGALAPGARRTVRVSAHPAGSRTPEYAAAVSSSLGETAPEDNTAETR
ncbi:DUF11 domain-containing protein [Actinomadura kijaniata]|uniref:DUF11 domain-containing protein n=1 Tax=Actinomadura kijaniata TaxID=46161 RepID=UPI003F1C5167